MCIQRKLVENHMTDLKHTEWVNRLQINDRIDTFDDSVQIHIILMYCPVFLY